VSLVDVLGWLAFTLFVVYTVATFSLIAVSFVEILLTKIARGDPFVPPVRLRRPGISVIAPAYNMGPLIVPCVSSLLASEYEPLEVVVVDDGSSDGTTQALVEAFDLVEFPIGDRLAIPTRPIIAAYVSRKDPRLRVVRKENGGRSDAINAGLNIAYTELVALTDADTLLEPDALERIGEVFALDPDDTIAVGGTIRILNGSTIDGNTVTEPRVPVYGIQTTQVAEYLRGFLGGRVAWSRMNALLIISGAFGVFRRDLLRAAGGLSRKTLGEDMELVMRLHHRLRPSHPPPLIRYAADANAWTEIPTGFRALRSQRIRWHVGLLDNLRLHPGMTFRRRYGTIGFCALPYTYAFEVLGPLLQIFGYGLLVVLAVLGRISWVTFVTLTVVTILLGQLETAGAIVIEEIGFHRYRSRDLTVIALWSLVETLWYRPITAIWRTWATALSVTGRRPGWGTIPRGTALHPDEELVSAPLPR
jgi:cellulose synthase/poly-beta-1,6-N-acetylglucosamine synthase-like glycosyltransferase